MLFANRCVPAALCSLICATILAGCSQSPNLGSQATAALSQPPDGLVRGGQPPVAGSVIQLYEVGTTGDGSPAKPLLTTTVTTSDGSGLMNANANVGNANNTYPVGAFTIANLYTLCDPGSYIYITGSGGNPGINTPTNNTDIQMFAVLGPCSVLTPSTFINVDEVTTVAGIAALYPYISSLSNIGYNSATDAAAFASAISTVNEYVDFSTGAAPGPTLPANTYASSAEINALADALSACVNSPGGSVSDGTVCGQLFSYAIPPSNTAPSNIFAATLNLLNNPSLNTANIYTVIPAYSPFQPIPSAPPTSWTFPILPIAAAPTFTPTPGTYTGSTGGTYPNSITVTALSATPSSTIYCTLDGSTPTTSSQAEQQANGIPLAVTATVQCFATASGYANSAITSAHYILKAATPTIGSAVISGQTTVFITPNESDIYYTTNGSTPNAGSTRYTGPFVTTPGKTIKAIAIPGVALSSDVSTYTVP